MPCHPHTARQRLWPFIRTPTSVSHLDNPRQRRTNPYGYPEYLRRPFDDSRGPSRTFAVLRSPSILFAVLRSPSITFEDLRDPSIPRRSPSRSFDPSSIPFGDPRADIAPSLRPRTIPQYLGHRPLSRRFPIAGFRTLFGSSVMLVGVRGTPYEPPQTPRSPLRSFETPRWPLRSPLK